MATLSTVAKQSDQSQSQPTAGPPRALGKMVAGGILATAALRFRDREATFCAGTGRRFSYAQTNERCNRLAHGLTDLGLRKPDVVGFLCNNRAELVEMYFALAKLGLVGIPVNYRLAAAEIASLCRAMGAKAFLFETRFLAAAEHVRAAVPKIKSFVAIGDKRPDWALGYENLLAGASAAEPQVEIEEHDPFYFNLTSGTTGLPKSYTLTHLNNCTISTMFEAFDLTSRDVIMTVFPAFGRVGYAWITAGLQFGARNVLVDFNPAETLRLVEAERVTLFNAVPTMGAMLLADPSLPTRNLSSLRGLVFAGSVFPATLRERVAAALCPAIYEYYGMQETGALTVSTPEDRKQQPDSIGHPVCFAEVRIERPDGSIAAPGEIGEIVGRSPSTVTAYFDNPQKTAETFRNGFVHTGDLGYFDEQGFLFIKGRLKDMIITGGQNVHAAEVEDAILAMAGVTDCAVFGTPDELWGERVSAVIVQAPGESAAITAEMVETHCRERLAGFKTPKSIFFSEEPLPRTPTGKVQKFLLVERYAELRRK
jgi:fatty-acyl-CoA synthase